MNMYPPWWGFPPPPNNGNGNDRGPSRKEIERAVRMAFQMRDGPKNAKRKRREELMKKAAQTRQKMVNSIEIFILGIIAYPIVGPLYNLLIAKLTHQ